MLQVHHQQLNEVLPWSTIRNLVTDMFSNGIVAGTNVGFYGGNGFCLFDYFVQRETQHRWYSIGILLSNLFCVLIIGVCYFLVFFFARKTSRAVSTNPTATNNNQALQRKISIIITTDIVTWFPFIVVCIINYFEVINAAHWYSIFCIFFLPINCLINPIGIYDDTVLGWLLKTWKKIKSMLISCYLFAASYLVVPEAVEEIEMSHV